MNHPSALITGVAGFAGSFLAENLLSHGFKVFGTRLPGESTANITHIKNELNLDRLDITKPEKCISLIKKIRPNHIFHLAAMASVGESFGKELLTYRVNFDGCVNLLRAAVELRSLKSFIMVSSGDTYGRFSPAGKTLTEDQPLRPLSPYGVAKAAAEQACHFYRHAYELPVLVIRSFNHSGPRQSDRFALPSFARQIAEIEAGKRKPPLKVGDLSAKRDVSDVRDIVEGYRLAALEGKAGEVYNLCSGQSRSIESILKLMLKMSERSIKIKVDRERLRKSDIPILRGSYRKAANHFGYAPRYTLKQTLADTLDYWRAQVR